MPLDPPVISAARSAKRPPLVERRLRRPFYHAHVPRRLLTLFVAAALLTGLVACGGGNGGGSDTVGKPAPSPASFPKPNGRTLEQLMKEGKRGDVVVSPSGQVHHRGRNRFGFGVFTTGRESIDDAQVALYFAEGRKGKAKGPYPARIEDLSTQARFRAKTTSDDPDAAQTVYVSEVDFPTDGEYRAIALVRRGGSLIATRLPSATVGQFEQVPKVGETAPRISTPTTQDARGDLSTIDTRQPPSSMHDEDLADVLGKKPVVLLFATPALCQSRVCGPVVDVAEQVKHELGHKAAFIFVEIYEDNNPEKGLRKQPKAYHLPSEPWLFVIDKQGRITTAIEGAFSVPELERAVRKASS
jgi:hypothetical protein